MGVYNYILISGEGGGTVQPAPRMCGINLASFMMAEYSFIFFKGKKMMILIDVEPRLTAGGGRGGQCGVRRRDVCCCGTCCSGLAGGSDDQEQSQTTN